MTNHTIETAKDGEEFVRVDPQYLAEIENNSIRYRRLVREWQMILFYFPRILLCLGGILGCSMVIWYSIAYLLAKFA